MSAKLERLLNLTATLLETRRPLTADEIYARIPGYSGSHQARQRSFERDKEDLREMGVPLELVEIPFTDPPAEGYRIPRDRYYLADPGLEPDELAALHLAAASVHVTGPEGATGAGSEALFRLGGAPPAEPTSRNDAVVALPTDDRLVSAFGALGERRKVRFSYKGTPRELELGRIEHRNGRWYLLGHDVDAGEDRSYRVDRIEGVVIPSDRFEPRASAVDEAADRTRAWEYGPGPARAARVLVDADQATWAERFLGAGAVASRRSDGSVEFALQVRNPVALRSFVLTFLDHAELLEPAELRAELIDWLEQLATPSSEGSR